MFLAFVTHDLTHNTLEATWLEPQMNGDGEVEAYRPVKSRNYSSDQKAEFEADCGAVGPKYTAMAGW